MVVLFESFEDVPVFCHFFHYIVHVSIRDIVLKLVGAKDHISVLKTDWKGRKFTIFIILFVEPLYWYRRGVFIFPKSCNFFSCHINYNRQAHDKHNCFTNSAKIRVLHFRLSSWIVFKWFSTCIMYIVMVSKSHCCLNINICIIVSRQADTYKYF